MRDLAAGPRRFVELQRVLPGISTEQLRSRLNRMVADGLLTRQRYREVPPRVDYELTDRSRSLLPVLGALARWGYEWAWSTPTTDEAVDIGAIFRVAPGLLVPPPDVTGTVELSVGLGNGESRPYTLVLGEGTATIEERPEDDADARVTGAESDWIEALGPDGDRTGLHVEGDDRLARFVLDGLSVPLVARAAPLG